MPKNLKTLSAAIFASLVLTACGGGGGSDEPKVDTTPTPTPTVDTNLVWDDENQKWDEAEWQ